MAPRRNLRRATGAVILLGLVAPLLPAAPALPTFLDGSGTPPTPPLRPASAVRETDLGHRAWVEAGFLDVTAAPFHADPTGRRDATAALQAAVDCARERQRVCFFPPGDYRLSDTLVCEQYRALKPDGQSRFGGRDYPCVLMGSRLGSRRPRLILAPRSPGFGDPARPKVFVHVWAPGTGREAPIDRPQPNISMNQMIVGLDLVIGPGNPGAVALRHRAAQGSSVQDCTIDVGDGLCGLQGGAGSGGGHVNVTVRGGRVGLDLRQTQPAATVTGVTLLDQRDVAVLCAGRQTTVLVGAVIVKRSPGPAIVTRPGWGAHNGQLSLVDSRIEYRGTTVPLAIQAAAGLTLHNVYFRGARHLVEQPDRPPLVPPATGDVNAWVRVGIFAGPVSQQARARSWNNRVYTYPSVVYRNGRRSDAPAVGALTNAPPPNDLQSRHVWDAGFPHWQSPAAVNVQAPPYHARGDGITDDHAALQRAVDEHRLVFLPRGTYALSRTLHLRPDTQLLGAHRCFTWLQPLARPGGDFTDAARPQPVVASADSADGHTVLAFLGIHTLTDSGAATNLHWQCGRHSLFRAVNTHFDLHAPAQGLTAPRPGTPAANAPLVLVDGHGGGRWYNVHQESSRGHGPAYRHLLIRNTTEPLTLYQCNPEHARSAANLEIRGARDVTLYGVKGEYSRPIVWIRDSQRIAVIGYGGNAAAAPGTSLFLVENSAPVLLANLVDSVRFPSGRPETFFAGDGVDPDQWFMLRERTPDGTWIDVPARERPVLYERSGPGAKPPFRALPRTVPDDAG